MGLVSADAETKTSRVVHASCCPPGPGPCGPGLRQRSHGFRPCHARHVGPFLRDPTRRLSGHRVTGAPAGPAALAASAGSLGWGPSERASGSNVLCRKGRRNPHLSLPANPGATEGPRKREAKRGPGASRVGDERHERAGSPAHPQRSPRREPGRGRWPDPRRAPGPAEAVARARSSGWARARNRARARARPTPEHLGPRSNAARGGTRAAARKGHLSCS